MDSDKGLGAFRAASGARLRANRRRSKPIRFTNAILRFRDGSTHEACVGYSPSAPLGPHTQIQLSTCSPTQIITKTKLAGHTQKVMHIQQQQQSLRNFYTVKVPRNET